MNERKGAFLVFLLLAAVIAGSALIVWGLLAFGTGWVR